MRPELRISIRSAIAVVLVVLAPLLPSAAKAQTAKRGPPLSKVTFRFGDEVIGPESALDVVVPSGLTGESNSTSGTPKAGEIWIGISTPSRDANRLSALANATAAGHPVRGSCEIVLRTGDKGTRHYLVSGCAVVRVDAAGGQGDAGTWRVMLAYQSISVS